MRALEAEAASYASEDAAAAAVTAFTDACRDARTAVEKASDRAMRFMRWNLKTQPQQNPAGLEAEEVEATTAEADILDKEL